MPAKSDDPVHLDYRADFIAAVWRSDKPRTQRNHLFREVVTLFDLSESNQSGSHQQIRDCLKGLVRYRITRHRTLGDLPGQGRVHGMGDA